MDASTIGRQLAEATKDAMPRVQAASIHLGWVHKVNGDGTIDINRGTLEKPELLLGVRCTSACYGAMAGDRVVYEDMNHRCYATGLLANQSRQPYRLLWKGKLTSTGQVATIPEGGLFTLFSLRYSDWTSSLIGLRTPSRNDNTSDRFVRFFGAYDNGRSHEMYIASFNLDETCTKWTYVGGCIDAFNGTATGMAGDMHIYGII